MDIRNSVAPRIRRLKQSLEYLEFSLGGASARDKVNSWLLRASMERPFEPRPEFVLTRIHQSGSVIAIRHSVYHNFLLKFDLLDDFEMAISRELFVEHAYNLEKLRFVPSTIIDCGAYRGYFTLMARKAFPHAKITAIEAHPDNVAKIREIFHLNGIENIELCHGALSGSKENVIKLHFEGSSGSLDDTFGNDGKEVEVSTLDLYKFVDHDYLLLKIDIEGAEMDFFPAIIDKLPLNCAVFLETHNGWNDLNPIKEKFAECRFAFEVLRDRGRFIDSFAQRVA